MNELKAKCDAIEKREAERRAVEEKKHTEEIQFLKRTNQQLKVHTGPQGILPKSLGGGVPHCSPNPDPISDQNILFFRPDPENLYP